jgi:hypothetical protein
MNGASQGAPWCEGKAPGRATSVPFTAVLAGPSGQPRTTAKQHRPALLTPLQVTIVADLALGAGAGSSEN